MLKETELKNIIKEKVFITNRQEQIGFRSDPEAWTFNFRQILMNGRSSDLISEIFYERFVKEYPFQICTQEIAGVPLATSLMNKFYAKGHRDINAFFIRKSRKKTNLFRMIEGVTDLDQKIILVDDVINSGNTFWRQIEVLEALGHKVDTVWAILRFRDDAAYERFHSRGIKVKSLFTLDDLTELLGANIKNLPALREKSPALLTPFSPQWVFKSDKPGLGWVCGKSQPILDDKHIYVGSDNKYFWAINQSDGSVAWKHGVGYVDKKKSIFSNPSLYRDTIIFGAYDGNVYCLYKDTGKVKWVNFEADWVGSSPAVAEDLGLVFIGLEYGLFRKMGGLIALDLDTGKPRWIDRTHRAYTHCSPHYIQQHKQVSIGSNDGIVRLHDGKTGKVLWKFTTFGAADYDPNEGRVGYSKGDIKEGFAYSHKHDYLIFGSIDGFLYILDRKTGHLVHHHKCEFGIFAIPYVYNNHVYFSSTDKHLRCINLDTLKLTFSINVDNTRMFDTPVIINDRLYIGTNGGRLYEIDPNTGEKSSYFQAIERITNSVVYNKKTDTYFLPTFANEIIALRRTDTTSGKKKS